MTESTFPPPPKVRESRFDDWMWRFYRSVDFGTIGAWQWTVSGSNIYRATGSVGLGAAPPSGQSASFPIFYLGSRWAISQTLSVDATNAYFDGSNWKRIGAGRASSVNHGSGEFAYYTSASSTADSTVTFTEAFRIKTNRETVLNPSYINVRQYRATGDGTTDDTTAISNALTDAAANGMRRVYFPQGTYRVTSALTIAGKFTLFGDGSSLSIIKVDHAGNGLVHTGNLASLEADKLTVQSMGFRSNNSGAGSAIKGTWTVTGTGAIPAVPACLISDVEINANSASAAFTKGIEFTSPGFGVIENVTVYGVESGAVATGTYGVYINGSTAYGTDFKIRDCVFHYVETGVYMVDVEGAHLNQNTFLSCLDGIKAETTTTVGKPYLDIVGNHANVGRYGIHIIEMVQFVIGDNLIYGDQRTPLAGTTFIGIRIESGSNGSGTETQSIVRDNLVLMVDESVSGYTTANYGYAVYGGSGTVESVLFKGNKSQGCDTLIYLDSSSTKVVILDDNIGTDGATWSDNGTLNSLPYGRYTPTGYGITNCTDGNLTEYEAYWTRTGEFVTVYGELDIDPTAANAVTTFRLSLPVPADLAGSLGLTGMLSSPSGANGPGGTFQMHTATSPDRAECNYYAVSASASRHSYTFRYIVA